MSKKHLGKIHVHTGDGHGKTTSALGMALRAIGHEYKVVVIQFMKGWEDVGEVNMAKKLDKLSIFSFGTGKFFKKGEGSSQDIALAEEGLARVHEIIKTDAPDILILDELNVAIYFNLLDVDNVIKILTKYRNKGTEIIITGRRAHKKIIDISDIVTEMKLIKHYYDKGVQAREGIEF